MTQGSPAGVNEPYFALTIEFLHSNFSHQVLVNFLLGLEIERFKAFASLPLYLFLAAFGQFAAYRARRYRLTRTIWRGVRFWMTGSGWSYAWRSLLWGLLLVPTLGFAYPWRMAAL